MWNKVVYAKTEEEWQDQWMKLSLKFEDQQVFLNYLERQWLRRRAQFLHCYTRRYRNFGVQATSGSESAHSEIKSYLEDRMTDLDTLFDQVAEMVNNKKSALEKRQADEVSRIRHKFREHLLLKALTTHVTFKALRLLHDNYLAAVADFRGITPLEECSGNYSRQMGLPCRHMMRRLLYSEPSSNGPVMKARSMISLQQIDPFWRLKRDLVSISFLLHDVEY
jgi:hypothetical protein